MIGVHRLCVTLGGREVLRDVSFAAGPGEFVAICGPNGAGKTTLLRGLAGLLPGGQVQPRRVGYLEQGARCAWDLTVAQTVTIGRIPWRDADLALVNVAMRECGVTELAGRRVDTLSGGQGRRVMLARALATQPEALLLDEPIADLDPRACHDVMRLLARQAHEGRIVVAVLHAVELAAAYCTRMVVLEEGQVRADAPPCQALSVAAACFGMLVGKDDRVRLMPPP